MSTTARSPQVNFQVDPDLLEDIKVLATRRGQTLSTFIRLTLEAELAADAVRSVREFDDGGPSSDQSIDRRDEEH